MSNELSRFNFNIASALLKFKDRLEQTANCKYRMKLYGKLAELHATKYGDFELWNLLKKSSYNYESTNVYDDFGRMLDFLDFISAVVYDTVDDGEIHLVKLETVGKEITLGTGVNMIVHKREDVKFFIVNKVLCCDSGIDDVAWLKKSYDEDMALFRFNESYDHLKISHKSLNFDDIVNIIDAIIKWSHIKERAMADYAKKNGLTEDEMRYDIEHGIEACKDVKDVDFTNVVFGWHVIDNVK